MLVQSNLAALSAQLNFNSVDRKFNDSLSKISTGMSLPKPEFGGGFFAVANDMTALYNTYVTGTQNIADAKGYLDVAQTTMLEANDIVLQMNDLATRAASNLVNTDQRQQLDAEYQQLINEYGDLYNEARYNDLSVFGAAGAAVTRTITFGEEQTLIVSTVNVTAGAINLVGALTTPGNATTAMGTMATAVNNMGDALAQMGAQISAVQSKVSIMEEASAQQKAMRGRVNEVDFAAEMQNFTSMQIVLQASNAMVAQSNIKAQSVLQLFG